MKLLGRILVVVLASLAVILGTPHLPKLIAFLLLVMCGLAIGIAIAPPLARWIAQTLVNLIYSTEGTTAPTDINDQVLYQKSQHVFSLMRTVSFLVLAAALYGFFWSIPILRQWSSIDDLAVMPAQMVAALIVCVASTAVWIFYLSVYFIPRLYTHLRDKWWAWRYRDDEE